MRLLLIGLSAALVVPATAIASGDGAAPAREKKERLICKNDITTATRTRPARRCMTAAEWRGEERDAKDDISGDRLVPEFVPTPAKAPG